MSDIHGERGLHLVNNPSQSSPVKRAATAASTHRPAIQIPDQTTALPDAVPVPAPTNPRKPARGKPQLKFFRGRFWDIYPNGDVIPARDEDLYAKLHGCNRES